MELTVSPPPATEFNFDSTCSSPYMTAPSSPHRFGTPATASASAAGGSFYFSAPPSPTRISAVFYSDLSAVPFQWEDKPGVPKSPKLHDDQSSSGNKEEEYDDFEFDFSGQLDKASFSALSAADELFDGGVIRPLKPPPGNSGEVSPRSPRSPKSGIISQVLTLSSSSSPRKMKDFEIDPFAAAIEETRRKEIGRSRSRGRTRSLSPMRVSDVIFGPEEESNSVKYDSGQLAPLKPGPPSPSPSPTTPSAYSSILSAISYKKWKLKEFLFRSASEGRAPRNDDVLSRPLKKSSNRVVSNDDVRNSSFRSTDSVGSSRRRGAPASAHEIHYTANRAVSEEMKRKTFLPYRRGLLGCLGFSHGVHEISRSFGSLSRA